MKFSAAAVAAALGTSAASPAAAAASSSSAFVVPPTPTFGVVPRSAASSAASTGTALFESSSARPDSSDAVKAAMEASEKYGAQSKEARLAWEAVEEMDASDNSAAFKGGINEEECLVDDPNKACEEYYEKLAELSRLIEEQRPTMDKVKSLATKVQNVNLSKPDAAKTPQNRDSPAMQRALAEAKEATEKFGITSPEARLAWETLEEIASSDLTEATRGSLDDECLVETIEACEAIEGLQRALDAEQQ